MQFIYKEGMRETVEEVDSAIAEALNIINTVTLSCKNK